LRGQVKDNVAAEGKASSVSEQFWPGAPDQGTPRKLPNLAINGCGEGVGSAQTILGDVGPNFADVLQRLRAYYNGRHLLCAGFAGFGDLASLPLQFCHPPRARRAAFKSFAHVAAQPFELKSVQFVLRLQQAQRFPHAFAGAPISANNAATSAGCPISRVLCEKWGFSAALPPPVLEHDTGGASNSPPVEFSRQF
jgi:hypothetical protein